MGVFGHKTFRHIKHILLFYHYSNYILMRDIVRKLRQTAKTEKEIEHKKVVCLMCLTQPILSSLENNKKEFQMVHKNEKKKYETKMCPLWWKIIFWVKHVRMRSSNSVWIGLDLIIVSDLEKKTYTHVESTIQCVQ